MTEMATAASLALDGRDPKLARMVAWMCVVMVVVGAGIALLGGFRATLASTGVVKPAAADWQALPAAARAAVSQSIGRDQAVFHAQNVAGGYTLSNTAGVSGRFTRLGSVLSAAGAHVHLSLGAVGYGAKLRALPSVTPSADANRVFYSHPGISEWYANGPAGLEHGFTLTRRPAGVRRGDLRLGLALSEGTTAHVDHNELGATLSDGTQALRYTGLSATDARGHRLPARLHTTGGRLTIAVDDHGAVYPITVDPFVQLAKLSAGDAAVDDVFGWSVAMTPDTIAVGQPANLSQNATNPGAVYVYQRGPGGWADATQVAKLTASDGLPGEALGYAVAIDGGTIVAGAPGHDSQKGAVYVFERPAGGWADETQTAELTRANGTAGDFLGISVAVSLDAIVAGAPIQTLNTDEEGAAYVFARPNSGWRDAATPSATLTASDQGEEHVFGLSLAMTPDSIVVGAPDFSGSGPGEAYEFTRPSTGWATATETAKLTPADGAPNDEFGISTTVSGTTIVVGAFNDEIASGIHPGSAYVFEEPAGGWINATQTAKLTASDGADGDEFGRSAAVVGNTIAIGAPTSDIAGRQNEGSVYLFDRPTAGWADATQSSKLTALDGAGDETSFFGVSVASAVGTLAVGASNSSSFRGLAYVENVDLTPPETTLLSGPPALTTDNTPTFTFTSEPNATFSCRVDNGAFAACVSPSTTAALTDGNHTFEVRARDGAGNVDPTPASQTFTVDTSAPDTTISSGPAGLINNNTPAFAFTSEAGARFECRVDNGAFAACPSPFTTAAQSDGAHTFQVRAVDQAGNADASPASRTFTVDTAAPDTTISSGPTGLTNNNKPVFGFSSEPGATFECRVDSGAFALCTSPTTTAALGDGAHTFQVRAVDLAGNKDASPASRTFTVDATPPETTITSGPPAASTSTTPSFGFASSEAGSTFACSIDGGAFASCTRAKTATLGGGAHTFAVRATDPAGNTDATAATSGFRICTGLLGGVGVILNGIVPNTGLLCS